MIGEEPGAIYPIVPGMLAEITELLFFWTDGKSFAEFLLEDEKKERAKSPLKQNKNPQEGNSLQQRKK